MSVILLIKIYILNKYVKKPLFEIKCNYDNKCYENRATFFECVVL